jgi:5-oxoprolinase (ATP-hydrolysing)
MAAAIRKISIARGHDVTRYTLACFGGRGPARLPRGRALGMERILVIRWRRALRLWHRPRRVKAVREASWLKPLGETSLPVSQALERQRRRPGRPGIRSRQIRFERRARLRTPAATRPSSST